MVKKFFKEESMPWYELKCPKCGHVIEIKDSINGDKRNTTSCPECEELMKNVISGNNTIRIYGWRSGKNGFGYYDRRVEGD